jgi:periplasmic divalent cation tolerance protein
MLLVLSTFPNAAKARLVGKLLVAERRAACVTLLPKAESFFEWEGKMEEASEVLAVFKTSESAYAGLEARLNELHPYDVPEIVAVPVARGLPPYLEWVAATCVGPAPADPGVAPMK